MRLKLGAAMAAFLAAVSICGRAAALDWERVSREVSKADSVLVADADGRILFEKNADALRIPASILKLFTALTAFHYLGPDHRFVTEFFTDAAGNLKIKGYGDPLLVSEVIEHIAASLAQRLDHVRDIELDARYFDAVTIPGVTDTLNPYDAPNGALCVNFNTVCFTMTNDRPISAEPQTPMLPMVFERIRGSGLTQGRIRLSAENGETLQYAGRMFRHFLTSKGVAVAGDVRTGAIEPARDVLVYRHESLFSLAETVAKMLAHSNNFMANQLLIAAGAQAFGPPGNLGKAREISKHFSKEVLGTTGISVVEGSGISRDNQVTARAMLKVLLAFAPYKSLMTSDDTGCFKTGSLSGVKTRAGYVNGHDGETYPFVVLHNRPGKNAERTARLIFRTLNPQ